MGVRQLPIIITFFFSLFFSSTNAQEIADELRSSHQKICNEFSTCINSTLNDSGVELNKDISNILINLNTDFKKNYQVAKSTDVALNLLNLYIQQINLLGICNDIKDDHQLLEKFIFTEFTHLNPELFDSVEAYEEQGKEICNGKFQNEAIRSVCLENFMALALKLTNCDEMKIESCVLSLSKSKCDVNFSKRTGFFRDACIKANAFINKVSLNIATNRNANSTEENIVSHCADNIPIKETVCIQSIKFQSQSMKNKCENRLFDFLNKSNCKNFSKVF